ncbi:hypothetical protein BAY59_36545 [Prauserella coralliicola]|nr:hypothetical protein BAY59_36545 [Prauserella coralliicola]
MKPRSLNIPVSAVCEQGEGDTLVSRPVQACWRYDITDPYALTLDVDSGPGTLAVRWTFARDLLADGLLRGEGEGDVYVAPDSESDARVWIVLTSPSGAARLAFSRSVLERVLDLSDQLVPLGSESERIDWGRELALLALGGEA